VVNRREVVFGMGDLAERMASLVAEAPADAGPPPPADGRPLAYVHVGHVFVSATPRVATTVLGSCVSVCLWDPALGAGGLNHFLLPHQGQPGEPSARYGDVAIEELLAALERLGCRRRSLRAKLFGGASVVDTGRAGADTLGMKNVAMARELLAATGIPVIGEDVGGTHGRKLVFHTDDGAAWVRKI
jgi:chemotaxis protein CheD